MAARDLLSRHETLAKLAGRSHRPCLHRTSLCPDECGHSSDTTDFDIIAYLDYEKPGQYGDEKQTRFFFDIKKGQGRGPAAATQELLTQKAAALVIGDWVLLSWLHEYVHDNGSSFPERPVTKMERITAEQAAAYQ